MKFNGSKFQLLRYGHKKDIKNNTIYFTSDMEKIIDQFASLQDLGVIMSDTARFDYHIEKVVTRHSKCPKLYKTQFRVNKIYCQKEREYFQNLNHEKLP